MSKKPYIPGPWRVCEEKHDDGTLVIRGSGDLEVPPDLVVALIVGGGPDDYDAGTAELIAAAPAMLDELKELRELVRSACAIADRKGESTAWDRFKASAAKLKLNGITARTYRVLPDDHDASV